MYSTITICTAYSDACVDDDWHQFLLTHHSPNVTAYIWSSDRFSVIVVQFLQATGFPVHTDMNISLHSVPILPTVYCTVGASTVSYSLTWFLSVQCKPSNCTVQFLESLHRTVRRALYRRCWRCDFDIALTLRIARVDFNKLRFLTQKSIKNER